MSLALTPCILSLSPDEIQLFSALSRYFSLLPTSHPSIMNPRLLLFGSESKRSRLLLFELQRFQSNSIPLRSLRLKIPLLELCFVDGTQFEPMIRLRIEEVGSEPNSGILEIRSIRLTAGEKEILSLPRFSAVFQRHSPVSPSVSTFSTFLGSKHKSKEAVFVDVPSNSSSFEKFFQHSKSNSNCSICVSISLPAVTIDLDQQSVLPFLQFLQLVEKNASNSTTLPPFPQFPFFIPAVYETPFLGVSLACPGVSLHVASDLFQWKERSRFLSLSLSSLRVDCFLGSQNFDCSLAFDSLRAALRFIHLASPLTLETLTGYPPLHPPNGETGETGETVETESWEAAKKRFASLSSREIEVLTVDSSRFHVSTSLHVLPSLHTWLLAAGEQSHSRVQLCEVGLGSRIRSDCELGMIELAWDDVGIADLVWAILTFCDVLAFLLPPRFEEEGEKRAGAELGGSDCLFHFTTPLLTLTLLYNQKPFQEIRIPAVLFEFGFSQHVGKNEVFPAQFVCGLQTRGAYWTDLTNDLPTSQVFLSIARFSIDSSLAKQRSRVFLGPLPTHMARGSRLLALQCFFPPFFSHTAPFVEVEIANGELLILVRQLMEIAKSSPSFSLSLPAGSSPPSTPPSCGSPTTISPIDAPAVSKFLRSPRISNSIPTRLSTSTNPPAPLPPNSKPT